MSVISAQKLQGYKRMERDKIQSSPSLTPARSLDNKHNVSIMARKIIKKHHAVLVALRDR